MKYIIFYVLLFNQILVADKSIYTEAKVAIKFIEKKDIQFVSAQDNIKIIKGSKTVDISTLSSSDILGHNSCTPYLVCPNKLKNILSLKGITANQNLVIYDDSYGIYAAQLYSVLESVGHKNMIILNGGANAISKIDLNMESYIKYHLELNSLKNSNENNESRKEIENLKEKLKVLKPLLLVGKKVSSVNKIEKTNYQLTKNSKDFLLSKEELVEAVAEVRSTEDLNITIVDVCPMVDIVGNKTGSYLTGVVALSWKEIIDKNKKSLKSKEELTAIFNKTGLDKKNSNYLYCMSGSAKALFMITAMREVGYLKVKAFTGDWNVWVGDIDE